MISKEEIEKAKEDIRNSYAMSTKHCLDNENKQLKQAIETLLQYIEELETSLKVDDIAIKCDVDLINEYREKIDKQNKIIKN